MGRESFSRGSIINGFLVSRLQYRVPERHYFIYLCVHSSAFVIPFPHASIFLCILAPAFQTGSIIVLIVVTNVLESDAMGNAWRMNGIQYEVVGSFDCLF
jgi:hypothetical protein